MAKLFPCRPCTSAELREATTHQFLADYFSSAQDVDYSNFEDCCWNDYVAWVATAGGILEDAAQAWIARGQYIAEWYDILEEATAAFKKKLLAERCEPDAGELRTLFAAIVGQHLEAT